jgi:catechol 2,3-dioxygenase-like lactoylglutathione lyase family enzyme
MIDRIFPAALIAVAGFMVWTPTLAVAADEAQAHHMHLATPNSSESVKWYVEYLACKIVAGRPKLVNCGEMDIEFVARTTLGGSQGTGVNHISFSFADVKAKMDELEAVGVRGSGVRLQRFADGSTLQNLPGLGKHGFIFDPWGTRIELVEDPDVLGFHHIHLQSVAPEDALTWYVDVLGAERGKFKGELDGLVFGSVWLLIEQYGDGKPAATDERSIDHLGFVMAELETASQRIADQGVDLQQAVVPEGARSQAKRAFLAGPDGVLIALVEPGWGGTEDALIAVEEKVATAPYTVVRTPWDEPDLQGIWTGNPSHGIPLERPVNAGETESLTPEQAAARRERGTLGSIWGYEREWRDTTLGYDKSAPSRQVAMVIDPPSGRIPPMTEKGRELAAAAREARGYARGELVSGPEDLPNFVRCITRGLPGLMMPGIYNNGLQIVQSPGYVAIQKEMIHETRVIPTTAKPHLGPKLKQWLGSSRGHWEGDTLVVQVKGFNGRAAYRGSSENMILTERYRRIDENTLEYQFTVDDPTVWTRPWTGMFRYAKDDSQYELVEYACHEGNYGMTNILSAARSKDKTES